MRIGRIAGLLLVISISAEAFFVLQSQRTSFLSSTARYLSQEEDNEDIADVSITWVDEDEDANESVVAPQQPAEQTKKKKPSRWDRLKPEIKQRLIEKGQERAIRNKLKRTSTQTKKRRQLLFVRQQQQQKKRASRIVRHVPLDNRIPLAALPDGMETTGQVISLTHYGAYVDVGSQVDGLLHISQMSRDTFVEHPRQMMRPGDFVTVQIKSKNPALQKLHLTMLTKEEQQLSSSSSMDTTATIPLCDLQVHDELWGEIVRVTDYGAYVQVGCPVLGFLHFMDHPQWDGTKAPCDFMAVGNRVRVWVLNVEHSLQRVQLTAIRPEQLPGPRRHLF